MWSFSLHTSSETEEVLTRREVASEEWLLSGCLTDPSVVPALAQKGQYFGSFVVALR